MDARLIGMTTFNSTVNELSYASPRLDAGLHHRTQWECMRLNVSALLALPLPLLLEVGGGATSSMPLSAAVSSVSSEPESTES